MCEVIRQLALGHRAWGVDSRVLCLAHDASPTLLDRPEAAVFRYPTTVDLASSPMSLRAMAAFPEHARWADLIHHHFPWPFGDLLHFTGGRSKPVVVTYQSDIVRQRWLFALYRPLMYRFLNRVDAIVATSPQYVATSDVLRRVKAPVSIIPNGVDESTLPEPPEAALTLARSRFGSGFVLFVGALRYYKGLDVLLSASSRLDVPILIAGDGAESARLAKRVAAESLANVRLLGAVSDEDKACLLRLCRAFVFPSHLRSEAFGISLLEAARFGKPLISCEIGTGTSFVNVDGETGLVVPPGDVSALAAAVRLLCRDEALAARLGQGARKRFELMFTAQRMASSYFDLYRQVCGA